MESLVPHEDIIEFFPGDDYSVKSLESLVLRVHQPKDVETVAVDLFDRVAVQSQRLQGGKAAKLTDFLQVSNVVSLELQIFELLETQNLPFNFDEIII